MYAEHLENGKQPHTGITVLGISQNNHQGTYVLDITIQSPMHNCTGDTIQSPMYNCAGGTIQSPMYNCTGGAIQSPMYNCTGGTIQSPMYNCTGI